MIALAGRDVRMGPDEVADRPGLGKAERMGAGTTLDMFTWVREKRYLLDNGEDFQRYHARRVSERDNGSTD